MSILTISKKFVGNQDLVVLSRREYESLLRAKKVKEFKPTAEQKKALLRANRNLQKGETLSFDELRKNLVSSR